MLRWPKVGLQRTGVVAVVGELAAAGVAEHVGMDGELDLGRHASASEHLGVARLGEGRMALAREDDGRGTRRGALA
jgi:hypothetical protein